MAFHREKKDLPLYTLTVAKGGSKLTKSSAAEDARAEGSPPLIFVMFPNRVKLPGRNATLGDLASVLQRAALDRPVVDQTGLPGRFDFDLEWTPDETQFGGGYAKSATLEEGSNPGLFSAIQRQLGLRLVAGRGPVDVLVIDRVERPTEN